MTDLSSRSQDDVVCDVLIMDEKSDDAHQKTDGSIHRFF